MSSLGSPKEQKAPPHNHPHPKRVIIKAPKTTDPPKEISFPELPIRDDIEGLEEVEEETKAPAKPVKQPPVKSLTIKEPSVKPSKKPPAIKKSTTVEPAEVATPIHEPPTPADL
jgi:hypothetical protein